MNESIKELTTIKEKKQQKKVVKSFVKDILSKDDVRAKSDDVDFKSLLKSFYKVINPNSKEVNRVTEFIDGMKDNTETVAEEVSNEMYNENRKNRNVVEDDLGLDELSLDELSLDERDDSIIAEEYGREDRGKMYQTFATKQDYTTIPLPEKIYLPTSKTKVAKKDFKNVITQLLTVNDNPKSKSNISASERDEYFQMAKTFNSELNKICSLIVNAKENLNTLKGNDQGALEEQKNKYEYILASSSNSIISQYNEMKEVIKEKFPDVVRQRDKMNELNTVIEKKLIKATTKIILNTMKEKSLNTQEIQDKGSSLSKKISSFFKTFVNKISNASDDIMNAKQEKQQKKAVKQFVKDILSSRTETGRESNVNTPFFLKSIYKVTNPNAKEPNRFTEYISGMDKRSEQVAEEVANSTKFENDYSLDSIGVQLNPLYKEDEESLDEVEEYEYRPKLYRSDSLRTNYEQDENSVDEVKKYKGRKNQYSAVPLSTIYEQDEEETVGEVEAYKGQNYILLDGDMNNETMTEDDRDDFLERDNETIPENGIDGSEEFSKDVVFSQNIIPPAPPLILEKLRANNKENLYQVPNNRVAKNSLPLPGFSIKQEDLMQQKSSLRSIKTLPTGTPTEVTNNKAIKPFGNSISTVRKFGSETDISKVEKIDLEAFKGRLKSIAGTESKGNSISTVRKFGSETNISKVEKIDFETLKGKLRPLSGTERQGFKVQSPKTEVENNKFPTLKPVGSSMLAASKPSAVNDLSKVAKVDIEALKGKLRPTTGAQWQDGNLLIKQSGSMQKKPENENSFTKVALRPSALLLKNNNNGVSSSAMMNDGKQNKPPAVAPKPSATIKPFSPDSLQNITAGNILSDKLSRSGSNASSFREKLSPKDSSPTKDYKDRLHSERDDQNKSGNNHSR